MTQLYPPYGRMIAEWESVIGDPERGSPPKGWKGRMDWSDWRQTVSTLLGDVLWPRWSPGGGWVGRADAFKHELTLADFRLFRDLRPLFDTDAALARGPTPHRKLFVIEDEEDATNPDTGEIVLNRSVDATLSLYLEGLMPPADAQAYVADYIKGLAFRCGNVDLEIKVDMQRPRAYQMGFILGEAWFTHRRAKSALTPSMISGHCLEMLAGGVDAFYRARTIGIPAQALEAVAQHTVDVGDRRVFAGVHYPSDNLSSWITGMLLWPQVCDDEDAAAWVWAAIQERSVVYKRIARAVEADGEWPYGRAFELLQLLGKGGDLTDVRNALKWALDQPEVSGPPAPGIAAE